MVAAKSLVAATPLGLACAMVCTVVFVAVRPPAALADNPTIKIRSADQAIAVAALLHQSDFGVGWHGGPVKPSKLTTPNCPGFNPKESDLVVTGHAEAKFAFGKSVVVFDQDVQVLTSAAAVAKDFSRTVKPQLAGCLAFQIRKAGNVERASVAKIDFPPVGTVSAAYRATIVLSGPKGDARFLSDYVFFGEGRLEYAFNVIAPVGAGDQLVRFESAIAEILLRRAGAAPA